VFLGKTTWLLALLRDQVTLPSFKLRLLRNFRNIRLTKIRSYFNSACVVAFVRPALQMEKSSEWLAGKIFVKFHVWEFSEDLLATSVLI
jgi:hypothetical protein